MKTRITKLFCICLAATLILCQVASAFTVSGDSTAAVTPTSYSDDFNDEKAGENPSHWIEDSVSDHVIDNWRVFDKGGLCYGTEKAKGRVNTWLHVFDNDPTVKMKFMFDDAADNAKIGFITRLAPSTAFLDIGYDLSKKSWYIAAQESEEKGTTYYDQKQKFEISQGEWYTAEIFEKGENVRVMINGTEVLNATGVIRTSYGRIGAFAENASMFIDDVACTFATGDYVLDGIAAAYVMSEKYYAAHLEIERADKNTLVGVNSSGYEFISKDDGITWTDVSDHRIYNLSFGTYPTLLELSDGSMLVFKITSDDVFCQRSVDGMKTWTYQGQIIPPEDQVNDFGVRNAIWHVNSATEVVLKDGTHRIFMPVAFRNYGLLGHGFAGHYTKFYYSDDFGKTWSCSENSTFEALPGYGIETEMTCAETKVIRCANGDLRAYYSRNHLGCMQYYVSHDEGKTWEETVYQIPEMQMPMTSSAVMEDKYEPGTFYMLALLGRCLSLGGMFPRNTLVLYKSTDGMNWEFQTYLERMSGITSYLNPNDDQYQILDPSLWIDEDYVYCTFGRSERAKETTHQEQRPYYMKIKKSALKSRPWDASIIPDMTYPKSIKINDMPPTKFGVGDRFDYTGTIEITDLNGDRRIEKTNKCFVYDQPNMTKLGKQTVKMYYSNDMCMEYEIEIVKNYKLTWNVSAGGKYDNKQKHIMDGGTKTFTLTPDEGNKVAKVLVNGKRVKVKDNTFTIKNATGDCTVDVTFGAVTLFDFWYTYAIIGVIVLAAAVLVFVFRKKIFTKKAQ